MKNLTSTEAANILGFNGKNISHFMTKLIKEGKIKKYRRGQPTMYDADEIEQVREQLFNPKLQNK